MPLTTRTKIPYPSEQRDPWFDDFERMIRDIDLKLFASWEDRNIFVMGGGTFTWNSVTNTLSWTGLVEFTSSVVGFLWNVEAGSLTINDGEFVFFQAVRAPTSNTTVSFLIGTKVPANNTQSANDAVMFAVRRGSKLYCRGGKILNNGDAVLLYESAAPGAVTLGSSSPTTVQAGDTAQVGVALFASHEDHQHAVDTALSGDLVATGTANAAGVSVKLPRADHAHRLELRVQDTGVAVGQRPIINFVNATVADDGGDDRINITIPSTSLGASTPQTVQAGAVGAAGVATSASREDHSHPVNTGLVGDVQVTVTANAAGVSTRVSRADHAHRLEVQVQDAGAAVGSRPKLNFVGFTVADDNVNDRVVVTSAPSIGGGGQYLWNHIPLALNENTDLNTFVSIGGGSVNASDHTVTGLTTAFLFEATAYVATGSLTGEVVLYNLTDSTTVHTFSFVGTTTPSTQSAVVALAGNKVYEVRHRVTGGVVITDRVYTMSAIVKVRLAF